MRLPVLLGLVGALLLSGCGDEPGKACFATADHGKYSDGRITAVCGCSLRQAKSWGVTEKDHDLLAATIRGKPVAAEEQAKAQSLGKLWSLAMMSCQKE